MAMKSSLFTNATDVESYKAGDVIFAKGSEGKVAYALVTGEVELISGERVLETLVPGAIFGEMALIDHLPRSATARVKTDCTVAPINLRRFEWLVQETPHFATMVMTTMAERLRRMNEQV